MEMREQDQGPQKEGDMDGSLAMQSPPGFLKMQLFLPTNLFSPREPFPVGVVPLVKRIPANFFLE